MVEEEIDDESIRCSECKSKLTYIRVKTNQRVCRSCGNIEDIIEKGVEDNEIRIEKEEVNN